MEKLVCIGDFEEAAIQLLDQNALEFYSSGADDEVTLRENRQAFHRWVIRPRVMTDITTRSLGKTILGKRVSFPVGVAPTGMQKLAHPDGEIASAKAAAEMGTIFILSTMSTTSIEEVAAATPGSRKWLQLYVFKDRELSRSLIRRAEAAGFEALCVTVDTPMLGKRRANLRNTFRLGRHLRLANFVTESSKSVGAGPESFASATLTDYVTSNFDQSLTWDAITWLKKTTRLPVIVKGVLTAEDAKLAVEYGVDGVFVSNHGGRQLDTVLPTIDALPEVVKAVDGRCEVYLDGGVSGGKDVFKALALGARMVFSGRPCLWGLAVGGEEGVKKVLQLYREELRTTMGLAGLSRVCHISPEYISRYSSL